jgi:hypothetical protein
VQARHQCAQVVDARLASVNLQPQPLHLPSCVVPPVVMMMLACPLTQPRR